MNVIDLCRALGIMLDNAIEEAVMCEVLLLRVSFIGKGRSVVISVINSCHENTPPIHKFVQYGFSTKGEGRGIGMRTLKEITDRYNLSIGIHMSRWIFCYRN